MQKPPKKTDYEELGKLIETVYETGYMNRGRLLRMNFLKGIAVGVGSVVGATIVISLLLWILSLLNFGPFRPIIENIQDTVEQAQL